MQFTWALGEKQTLQEGGVLGERRYLRPINLSILAVHPQTGPRPLATPNLSAHVGALEVASYR